VQLSAEQSKRQAIGLTAIPALSYCGIMRGFNFGEVNE